MELHITDIVISPEVQYINSIDRRKKVLLHTMTSNNWSNRDEAIVPWISLRKSPDGESTIVSSMHHASSQDNVSNVHASHQDINQLPTSVTGNGPRSCKILSLLGARERVGSKGQCGRIGWLSEGVVVTDDGLARVGAW